MIIIIKFHNLYLIILFFIYLCLSFIVNYKSDSFNILEIIIYNFFIRKSFI